MKTSVSKDVVDTIDVIGRLVSAVLLNKIASTRGSSDGYSAYNTGNSPISEKDLGQAINTLKQLFADANLKTRSKLQTELCEELEAIFSSL